jgi:hypothetical protein
MVPPLIKKKSMQLSTFFLTCLTIRETKNYGGERERLFAPFPSHKVLVETRMDVEENVRFTISNLKGLWGGRLRKRIKFI